MKREPEGIPVGGQFATDRKAEADVTLDAPAPQSDSSYVDLAANIGAKYVGKDVDLDESEPFDIYTLFEDVTGRDYDHTSHQDERDILVYADAFEKAAAGEPAPEISGDAQHLDSEGVSDLIDTLKAGYDDPDDGPFFDLDDDRLIVTHPEGVQEEIRATDGIFRIRVNDLNEDDPHMASRKSITAAEAIDGEEEGSNGSIEDQVEAIAEGLRKEPGGYDLAFVERGDGLTPEQANAILEGDWELAEEQITEHHSDQVFDRAEEIARESVEEHGLDWDDLDDDQKDQLRETVMDRDESNPLDDHLTQHPAELVRIPVAPQQNLSSLVGDAWVGNREGSTAKREQVISDLLTGAGVDTSSAEVRQAISELVEEGPYDWSDSVRLDVLWHGPIGDVAATPREEIGLSGTRSLSFSSPSVVLIDTQSGSGYETTIPGTVTTKIDSQTGAKPTLDYMSNGYGWDQTAGVVKSAYRGSVTSEWTPGS